MFNVKTTNLIALPNSRINEVLCNFRNHPFLAHSEVYKTYKKLSNIISGQQYIRILEYLCLLLKTKSRSPMVKIAKNLRMTI